jgi:predicted metal-dependent peptidase
MSTNDLITKIAERWFLMEPALFRIYCGQDFSENRQMTCPVRCGKGKVEYNPDLITDFDFARMEESLRVEMIRLFLKHPYQRQPEGSLREALTLGSNWVIDQHYGLLYQGYSKAREYQLPNGECFEWYVGKLNVLLRQPSPPDKTDPNKTGDSDKKSNQRSDEADDPDSGEEEENGHTPEDKQQKQEQEQNDKNTQKGGDGSQTQEGPTPHDQRQQLADQSELWEEDELRQEEINEIIRNTTDWGSIPGNMIERIIASLQVKMDYRKALSAFHTSILSSKRRLTRMKPNRRSGFAQMGSRYDLASNILVAVDVSGSIDSRTLRAFYSAIARFFKYGVETIDVVQFDIGLREVTTFKKRPKTVEVRGRGGTEFQSVFNHLKTHTQYDGLIIFTDGYALEPRVDFKMRTKVLWVCRSEEEYQRHQEWMRHTGKVCWMKFN